MPQVDSLLKVLTEMGGNELCLVRGRVPRLLRAGTPLKFFFPELTHDLFDDLVADLITDERERERAEQGVVTFTYTRTAGHDYTVELRGETRATFKRLNRRPAPTVANDSTRAAPQPSTPTFDAAPAHPKTRTTTDATSPTSESAAPTEPLVDHTFHPPSWTAPSRT